MKNSNKIKAIIVLNGDMRSKGMIVLNVA